MNRISEGKKTLVAASRNVRGPPAVLWIPRENNGASELEQRFSQLFIIFTVITSPRESISPKSIPQPDNFLQRDFPPLDSSETRLKLNFERFNSRPAEFAFE
jgi:hypothetical protein